MNVISCFDGMAGACQAIKNLGITPSFYGAFEVDKYAIEIAKKNHNEINQFGSVINWKYYRPMFPENIDLIIGGSPCQDLSIAGKRKGLKGERSGLFWTLADMIKKINPRYFLVENVASMSKEAKQTITETLGVEPILINSALVTAQNRKRLYWTNIPGIEQPEDKKVYLKDIIETGLVDREKSYCIDANYFKGGSVKNYLEKKRRKVVFDEKVNFTQSELRLMVKDKSSCLPATYYKENVKSLIKRRKKGLPVCMEDSIRKLTPIECERLQGFPDNYTQGVSNTQRYKMLGNGFTVPIIEHILEGARP